MFLSPVRTALQQVTPAFQAVGHIAWWVGWHTRQTAGAGARAADRADSHSAGEECATA